MSKIKKTSTIQVKVELDDKNIPKKISWMGDDQPEKKGFTECKAFSLALFEKEYKDTLRIDLWTQDFQVSEMDRFMFNTLKGMAETYARATKNDQLADDMRKFVHFFGVQTKIIETPAT